MNTAEDRRFSRIVLAGCIAVAALRLLSTPYVAPNRYPFTMNDDTWEWIAQGLHYLGYDFPNNYRPPLFSALAAATIWSGLEKGFGYIVQCAALAGVAATGVVAWQLAGLETAAVTMLLLLLDKHFMLFSLFLNPDIMHASLVAAGMALLLDGRRWPTAAAWVALALSLAAQKNVASVAAFVAVALYVTPRHVLVRRHAEGVVAFVLLSAVHYLFLFQFGASFSSRYQQDLFMQDIGMLWWYASRTAVAMTAVGGILFGYGVAVMSRERHVRPSPLVVCALWAMPSFLFYACFWATPLGRWMFYYLFPLFVIMSIGFIRLVRPLPLYGKCLCLALAAVSMNAAATAEMLDYSPSRIVVAPGISLSAEGRVAAEPTALALPYLLSRDSDTLRRQMARNIFPDQLEEIAQLLQRHVRDDEQYTIVPLTQPAQSRIQIRLHVLSHRTYRHPETYRFLDAGDPWLATLGAIVVLDLPVSDYNLRRYAPEAGVLNSIVWPDQLAERKAVMTGLIDSGQFKPVYHDGLFHLYVRTRARADRARKEGT